MFYYILVLAQHCDSTITILFADSLVHLPDETDIFFNPGGQDIAAAIDEEDVAKFTDVVKEFDSMTPLVSSKSC